MSNGFSFNFLSNPYILTLLSTASKILVRVITFIIIAPILGPTAQGTLVFNSALSAVVILLLVFGLPVRALREISSNISGAREHFRGDLLLMIALIIPTLLLGLVVFYFAGRSSEVSIFLILLASAAATEFGNYGSAVFRATGNFTEEAWIGLATGVLHILLVVCSALYYNDLASVCLAILVSRVIFALVSTYRVHRKLINKLYTSTGSVEYRMLERAKESVPYAFDAFFATVITNIDVLILEYVVDREALGLYSAGSRFVGLFLIIPPLLQNVIIPVLVRSQGSAKYWEQRRIIRFGFILFSLFGACSILFLGPVFTKYILGNEYLALNALWIYFSIFLCARVYESYSGIIMYASGMVTSRVLRLALGIASMMVSGYWAAMYFSVPGFIICIALCYCLIAISYPNSNNK